MVMSSATVFLRSISDLCMRYYIYLYLISPYCEVWLFYYKQLCKAFFFKITFFCSAAITHILHIWASN